jgi:hypothetical protein
LCNAFGVKSKGNTKGCVMAKPKPLNMKPLPKMVWDDIYWSGMIKLPAWANFWDGANGVTSKSNCVLFVDCEDFDEDEDEPEPTPPTPAQATACQALSDDAEAIRAAVLEASLKYAKSILKDYDVARANVEKHLGGKLEHAEQMQLLISRPIIHILPTELKKQAYVGFEFSAFWDPEHGFGVLTHASRVIAVDDAETANDTGRAERDRKKPKK